jgi:6-phosphogluconate dehydrogenase
MQLGMIGPGQMGFNMVRRPGALWMMVPAAAVDQTLKTLIPLLERGDVVIDGGNSCSVPAPVLSAALFDRFSLRGEADFGDNVLSAIRYQFGGHEEKPGT